MPTPPTPAPPPCAYHLSIDHKGPQTGQEGGGQGGGWVGGGGEEKQKEIEEEEEGRAQMGTQMGPNGQFNGFQLEWNQ